MNDKHFDDPVELSLVKVNGQYWALKDNECNPLLDLVASCSHSLIGQIYNAELLGNVKIPNSYFEEIVDQLVEKNYEKHIKAQNKKLPSQEDLNKAFLPHREDGLDISCDRGWWPLLIELNERLEAIDPNYKWSYAKEEYAVLHAWAIPSSEDCWPGFRDLFDEYLQKSRGICEECGVPADGGRCYIDGFWEKTYCQLCKEHFGGADDEDMHY